VKRRTFLRASALALGSMTLGGGVFSASARGAESTTRLRAGSFKRQFQGIGAPTTLWGFNDSLPGPLLRFRKGDKVSIGVDNALPVLTTVHWHGLRVPNAMDGVPFVTQPPIEPGASFLYQFELKDSGTYWYHPHQKSFEQVGRGLFGALIVEEEKPIEVNQDIVWVLSDFKLDPATGEHARFGSVAESAGEGRLGKLITINGKVAGPGLAVDVRSGERVRLRLINAATARVFELSFDGHAPLVIAFDGQGVTPHKPPDGSVLLGPGMRVDLIIDCAGTPESRFAVTDSISRVALATIIYSASAPLQVTLWNAPMTLSKNDLPRLNLKKAAQHSIEFAGGDAGPPVIGRVDGKDIGYREMLTKYGLAWTVNSYATHEDALAHVPILFLKQGETHVISIANNTGFVHPIHLHGHFFRVLSYNGIKPQFEEWRDTVFMKSWDELQIAFVAEERGDWMFHCHILEHAAAGMMGVVRIE
jgi:FtsP/CotA-like multicopper oxidase with cupredoxin domain